MPLSADEVSEQVIEEIHRLFSEVKLTPEEKEFVRDTGARLASDALQLFTAAKSMERLRPLVIAFAIAAVLGPPQVWQAGVDALARERSA